METAADRYYARVFPNEVEFVRHISLVNSICVPNHHWTFTADQSEPTEGQKCDCGSIRYHIEKCPYCGTEFISNTKL
jgi:hypothetical protein